MVGAFVIAAAILLNGFLERRAHIPADSSLAMGTVTAPAQTIAVLPFTSLNPDSDNSLGEGIQREIVTRLTAKHVKAAGVRETPRTGEVLVGTVQRAGDRVRVTVQLVDAASRLPRWAESYDRELTDVFALQSEIAEIVAKAVAATQKA